MKCPNIFVVDFEGSVHGGIQEFGVVTLRGQNIEDPQTEICAHYSSREGVKHPFLHHFPLFRSLRQRGIFAAHSSQTEDSFLRFHWPTAGPVRDWLCDGRCTLHWGPWIDTLLLCRLYFPQYRPFTLRRIIDGFQLANEVQQLAWSMCPPHRCHYHCALYDSIACAVLLRKLFCIIPLTPSEALRQSLPSKRRREERQNALHL
jgi:DNA polymerase III epsilon subunit-like protein